MKSGFVSIIGRPNVGKSTLLNTIVNEKVAITTDKPGTTRDIIQGVYNEPNYQIIFVDTPGIGKFSSKLNKYLSKEALSLTNEVDVILFVVDVTKSFGSGEKFILKCLEHTECPVILVLNKIDLIPNERILLKIDEYKDLYNFSEIVPISSLANDNVNHLVDVIKKYLKDDIKYFEDDVFTSNTTSFMVSEFVREKLFELTNKEIPYRITCVTSKYEDKKDIVNINVDIIVDKDSLKRIIIGKGGEKLKEVGTLARMDIEHLLGKKVYLELFVKTIKNWYDKEKYLKEFGFKDFE